MPHAGFANEGQFLLLSAASLREVASRLPEDTGSSAPGKAGKAPSAASQDPGHVARFRPNLVVDGPELRPFEEDDWQGVRIGACSLRTNSESPTPAWACNGGCTVCSCNQAASQPAHACGIKAVCFLGSAASQLDL